MKKFEIIYKNSILTLKLSLVLGKYHEKKKKYKKKGFLVFDFIMKTIKKKSIIIKIS